MISNLEFYTQPNDIEGEGFQTSTILKKKLFDDEQNWGKKKNSHNNKKWSIFQDMNTAIKMTDRGKSGLWPLGG